MPSAKPDKMCVSRIGRHQKCETNALKQKSIQAFHRFTQIYILLPLTDKKGKGKVVPLQVWSGPEGSRKLRFPDYMTTAQDGGKFVSLAHRLPLSPGSAPGTHFR
jgi:hypothetical protein